MRIFVMKNGETRVDLHVPTGLLLNPVSATLASAFIKEKDGSRYTGEQLRKAAQVLKDYKRSHPDWVLVEVDTHEGEHVNITL